MNASNTRTAWWVLIFIFTFLSLSNIGGFITLFGRTSLTEKPEEKLRELDLRARMLIGVPFRSSTTKNSPDVDELVRALQKLFNTPIEGEARRRLAVLEYEFKHGDPLEMLRPLPNAKDSLSGEALRRNAEAWMKLYGEVPPKREEIPVIVKEIRSTPLGWWAKLAESHAYERAGDVMRSEQLRKEIRSESTTLALTFGGLLCLLVLAGLVGLIVWIVVLLFKRWRSLPERPFPDMHPEILDGSLWGVNLFFIIAFAIGLLGLRSDTLFLTELAYLGIAVGVLSYLRSWSRTTGISFKSLGLLPQKPFQEIVSGVLAYCAYLVPLVPIMILLSFLWSVLPEQTNPLTEKAMDELSMWEKISIFLQAAVFAPFIEEIVFRGLLFSVLWQRTGRVWLSAFASGYLFAVIHPQFLGGLVAITLLGTLTALLYAYTRSLLPCMIVHALNNGAVTLFVFLYGFDKGL